MGLRLGAEHILQTSRKIVPIDEATLERSGKVSVDEAEMKAAVSYDTPYAVIQHEDLTLNHKNGRSAKYLERPFTSETETVRQIIAQAIKDGVGFQ